MKRKGAYKKYIAKYGPGGDLATKVVPAGVAYGNTTQAQGVNSSMADILKDPYAFSYKQGITTLTRPQWNKLLPEQQQAIWRQGLSSMGFNQTGDNTFQNFGNGGPIIVPGTNYIARGEYPGVTNKDGRVSNEISGSFEIDGKHYLLPTFWDGVEHTDKKEITDRFKTTKEHLGVFDSEEEAQRGAHYREWMNNQLTMKNGGSIKKFGPGGNITSVTPTKTTDPTPIYVTDPNDPRYKAYTDSLNLYNSSKWIKEHPFTGSYIPTAEDIKYINSNIDATAVKKYNPKMALTNTGYFYDYKKPVQPVKLGRPQATTEPINTNTKTSADIKPMSKHTTPQMLRFAYPAANNADNKVDTYSYNPQTKQYEFSDAISVDEAKERGFIIRKDLKSVQAAISQVNPRQHFGMGGAIGTTIGTALNFIPGIGPIASAIATPLLTGLGNQIDANNADKPKTMEEMAAKTQNPYGFYKKGGKMSYYGPGGGLNTKEVYDYLISKGLSPAHAQGMMANIHAESSFNPGAIGDDNTSGGLFQHHNERFDAMKSFAGDDWMTDWKGQIDYALSEPDTQKYLSQQFKDAAEASKWFTINWERPVDAEAKAVQRLSYFGTGTPIKETPGVVNPATALKQGAVKPMPKQYLTTFKQGGKTPGKLIPLKQEGEFKELGNDMYLAKGPSHINGGIDADLASPSGQMDGIPEVNLEGEEIVIDDIGYIINKDIAKPYLNALKKMLGRTDQVSKNTRDLLKQQMIKENEFKLNPSPATTMKWGGKMYAEDGINLEAPYANNFYSNPLQTETGIQPVVPGMFYSDANIPSIKPAANLVMPGVEMSPLERFLQNPVANSTIPAADAILGSPSATAMNERAASTTAPDSSGYTTTSPANPNAKMGNTTGDYLQLAGIAVPALYNLARGLQPAEIAKPIYNPYESQIKSVMASRSYNPQTVQNQITRALSTGISGVNNATNSASVRRSNLSNLVASAEQQRAGADLQGQQMNNQYKSEYASTLNNLGAQRTAAELQAEQQTLMNKGAKDAYISTGVTQLGQGLDAFGKAKNMSGYNNLALNIMNNAFPNYYFDINTINSIASGTKPSWMTDEDFAKAQELIKYKG